MSNLFNTLSIGYSGLRAAQSGISTTAHNISNAENEGYTRQRVVTAAATPLSAAPGNIGNGVQVQDIKEFLTTLYLRDTPIFQLKKSIAILNHVLLMSSLPTFLRLME